MIEIGILIAMVLMAIAFMAGRYIGKQEADIEVMTESRNLVENSKQMLFEARKTQADTKTLYEKIKTDGKKAHSLRNRVAELQDELIATLEERNRLFKILTDLGHK